MVQRSVVLNPPYAYDRITMLFNLHHFTKVAQTRFISLQQEQIRISLFETQHK